MQFWTNFHFFVHIGAMLLVLVPVGKGDKGDKAKSDKAKSDAKAPPAKDTKAD